MYPKKSSGRERYGVPQQLGTQVALVGIVVALGASTSPAQFVAEQRLTASDAQRLDYFGASISVSGTAMLVGADYVDSATGENTGAVYAYRFDGIEWVQQQKLTASDAEPGEFFGRSVFVNGNLAIVNAIEGCPVRYYCGAAYVFRFDGTEWIEEQKLTASDPQDGDKFGYSIAASGNLLVMGAPGDYCEAGDSCGSAYVFRFNGTSWIEEQRITAFERMTGAQFGNAVGVSGNSVLVAATSETCAGDFNCGAAYVFRFNGTSWVDEQKLVGADVSPDDMFGFSASLSGDTIAIGASTSDCGAVRNCGAAYIFRRRIGNWVEEQKLNASDATTDNYFGTSISVSGNRVVVGANGFDCAAGPNCGAAYVYRFDGDSWVDEQKLTDPDAGEYDHLGKSVSVSNDTVVVAVSFDDEVCPTMTCCNSGSAIVFRAIPTTLLAPPVPSVSAWGLACLTLLLIAGATITIRKTTSSNGAMAHP